jgi:hypothetical protein
MFNFPKNIYIWKKKFKEIFSKLSQINAKATLGCLPWYSHFRKLRKLKLNIQWTFFKMGGPNKNYIVLLPLHSRVQRGQVSDFFIFLGEISPNFNLKNMISTYAKDFAWKKMTQIHQIKNKIKSKSPDFYDKFQKVANNIKGFWFFFYFHT